MLASGPVFQPSIIPLFHAAARVAKHKKHYISSKLKKFRDVVLLTLDFFNDLGDKEGKDKQGNREKNLKRNQLYPVTGCPNIF